MGRYLPAQLCLEYDEFARDHPQRTDGGQCSGRPVSTKEDRYSASSRLHPGGPKFRRYSESARHRKEREVNDGLRSVGNATLYSVREQAAAASVDDGVDAVAKAEFGQDSGDVSPHNRN